MDCFEKLLKEHRGCVERFVRYRLDAREDADDCLQEIYLAAYQKFSQLKDKEAFKSWILRIARNKCTDYFRRKSSSPEIPVGDVTEIAPMDSRYGAAYTDAVRETLDRLRDRDRQILSLYFWQELSQAEIAQTLHIPLGTVKSRLHTARRNFKNQYPYCRTHSQKGYPDMKKLPESLPEYEIKQSTDAPFSVKWEELMGWFLVPKPGEKLSWGMYDIPSRMCRHVYDMEVTGKAIVHGIEGVELTAREAPCSHREAAANRTFVAQLTDTHCRYLAALRTDGDIRHYITFLDEEEFMPIWGFGENNCGNETNLSPKGRIRRSGQTIIGTGNDFLLDIVGRYTVSIGGKRYDTVCIMYIESCGCGVVSEQFLDDSGRTILWRRFNRNDWAMEQYGREWTELLPRNERLSVNGITYVHWYDCITDYIL